MTTVYRAKCDFELRRQMTAASPLVTIFKAVRGQLVTVIGHMSPKWSQIVDGSRMVLVPNFEFMDYLESVEEQPCGSTS